MTWKKHTGQSNSVRESKQVVRICTLKIINKNTTYKMGDNITIMCKCKFIEGKYDDTVKIYYWQHNMQT